MEDTTPCASWSTSESLDVNDWTQSFLDIFEPNAASMIPSPFFRSRGKPVLGSGLRTKNGLAL